MLSNFSEKEEVEKMSLGSQVASGLPDLMPYEPLDIMTIFNPFLPTDLI